VVQEDFPNGSILKTPMDGAGLALEAVTYWDPADSTEREAETRDEESSSYLTTSSGTEMASLMTGRSR